MRHAPAALAALLVLAAAAPRPALADEHKFVVPGIQSTTQADRPAAKVLTELVLDALLNRHGIRALGPSDIKSLLSVDAQKQLLGCSDASCMATLGGAVNADLVVTGQVGRLGKLYVVTLKLLDAKDAKLLARSSAQLKHLEDAAKVVGPLVDKLVGAPARQAQHLAILGASQPAKTAMDPRRFCPRVTKYFDQLAGEPYAASLVKGRAALMKDLMITRLKADFDEKRGCIWDREPRVEQPLAHGIERADTAADALDHRRRLAECLEMVRDLKRVEEAWTTGLEEATHGTGNRPTELPFTVGPAILSTPTHPKLVERLRRAWPKAEKVVARLISRAKQGNLKRFSALYDDTKDRTSPRYNLEALKGRFKNKYRVNPCPLFIFSGQQQDDRAVELNRRGLLRFCVRYRRPDWVNTDTLFLKKVKGRWRIDHW